jgi:lysine 6-dehydrogenase
VGVQQDITHFILVKESKACAIYDQEPVQEIIDYENQDLRGNNMGFNYAVLGAGRQGIAAAYDLAKFGDADLVILADLDLSYSEKGAKSLNNLLGKSKVKPYSVDVKDSENLEELLDKMNAVISCVPYDFNLEIMKTALKTKTNMCDLGGHTQTVLKQREFDSHIKEKEISVVPDCGMGPGMNISLAKYAMSLLDEPREVRIWDGGLPQNPQPPWNYALTFNIGGLTNEYFGDAYFLRKGKITEVPCFEGYEKLDFPPPLNKLEAFVTSGGLSTMPWTFEGKLKVLENKTLRYPGHHKQFKAFSDLRMLETEPIMVGDTKVVPREVLHALLEPLLTKPDVRDIAVIIVKCRGVKDAKEAEATIELTDYFDEETKFTAMQRLTGWHAAIVAILCTQNRLPKGVIPIETISGEMIVEEARKRGFDIKEGITNLV